MAVANGLKRKAVTRDSPEAESVRLSNGGKGIHLNDAHIESHFSGGSSQDLTSEESDHPELDLDEFSSGVDEIASDDGRDNGNPFSRRQAERELSRELSPEEEIALENSEDRNFKVRTDANGNVRYLYQQIDPGYGSDDSDAPVAANTIGNIPLSYYDSYNHVGYTIDGKKIARPAEEGALDALLDSIDIPKGWTGLTDPATGKSLNLSQQELQLLKRVGLNEVPEEGFDPYPPTVEWFTSKIEPMPLSAAPEPKRRYVPSKHEAKRVMKIAKAIKEGRIQPWRPPEERDTKQDGPVLYDLWKNEQPRPDHPMHIPAPKQPPPDHDASYHPAPEYLPDESESKAWDEADDEDRQGKFLPKDHDALRKVPAYENFVQEYFNRCLDLYLAPRIRRNKLDMDPEDLLPKLPRPEDLRPFPSTCSIVIHGATGRVRTAAVSPSGNWLATGGDDGYVRIYEVKTGHLDWTVRLSKDEAIDAVQWRPSLEAAVLVAACGNEIFLIVPSIAYHTISSVSEKLLDAGFGYLAGSTKSSSKKDPAAQWSRPSSRLRESGVLIMVELRAPVKVISWHRGGEYFSTVAPSGQSHAVAIHSLSKHLTQLPFRGLQGLAQFAQFHPSKPYFFIATQHTIRCYDLTRQQLLKIIRPGTKWISSFDVHSGGDNLLVGTYDRRLLWHDLELDARPFKTLRYHKKAIRAVKFHHGSYPLFADASDDGSVQVFHGKVTNDSMENATIVPLKVLRGHEVKDQLGVMAVDWHTSMPWLVSAGADGTCRIWT